jgi:hypothetical protein
MTTAWRSTLIVSPRRWALIERTRDEAEQPGVGVGELLTGVGVRGIHAGQDPVGHDLAVRVVLGP